MIREVVLSDRAANERESAYQWWARNRSQKQAAKWYNILADAIESLAKNADGCPCSRESDRFPYEIRDLYFGLRRRPTHRAVFTIRGKKVIVLTIRHLSQQDLTPDDLQNLF